jgi:hypothetical protein
MVAADILRIAVTVGVVQAICDLVAHYWIYASESYRQMLERLQRATTKVESFQKGKTAGAGEKYAKRQKAAEDEKSVLVAIVARQHTLPNVYVSVLFLILMKIMSSEHAGRIIAVLPFVPPALLRRWVTARGLVFVENAHNVPMDGGEKKLGVGVDGIYQACSFTFIYILATLSVKYYVNQLLGTRPPPGAESLSTAVETPQGKAMMKRWMGIDVDEYNRQIGRGTDETTK